MRGGIAMVFFFFLSDDWRGLGGFAMNGAGGVGLGRGFLPLGVGFFMSGVCGMGRRGASLVSFGMSRFGFMLGRRFGLR
jgi:hypothetical protein